jgi:beta-phosphoglucomutase-like phosphatase (HAD superfamily)
MCHRCDEIDKTIERYRRITERILDQPLIDGVKELIAQLEADKVAIGCGQSGKE